MTELKTKENDASVDDFIGSVEDKQKREDAKKLIKIFSEVTGEKPKMWGSSIIGFGQYHYKYPTGREANWMQTGFSPRKRQLTIYLMNGFKRYKTELSQLGPHSTGKACLYIKRLSDIDEKVLRRMIKDSVAWTKSMDGKMAY